MSLEWEMACLRTRIVIPKQLRCQVLELAHEGHPGILAMKQRLRTKVWWPGIDRGGERKEKGKVYADCQRNACESEIRKGVKVLLRQEKEKKLSTPHSLPLQLFKRMAMVFLLRLMVCSTAGM